MDGKIQCRFRGRLILVFIVFTLCRCAGLNQVMNTPKESELPGQFELIPQKTQMWCWAASAEMCMRYLGETGVRQCEEANRKFGRTDCCNSPVPALCINGSFPDFDRYNFSYSRTSMTALSWMEIKRQIGTLKKPVAFSWKYIDNSGHMMVITGYSTIDGTNWLSIYDPLEVNVGSRYSITYDEYVSGPTHSHWDDFYNLTKRG